MNLTEQEISKIRQQYKRCSPETIEAILRFRQSSDPAEIPAIVRGIVQRYLPADSAAAFANVSPDTTLTDLRIESLTLLEIVLDVQDAVNMVIEDAELREIKTLGDVDRFLQQKLANK